MSGLVQGTPEWLEFRRKHIGASDAPIIMGVSPWKTPLMLWQEKLGLVEPPKGNWATDRGTAMEDPARKAFEEKIGDICIPGVKISQEYPWMMASYDGLSLDEDWAVEIKNPGIDDHKIAVSGKIPDKYVPQIQHQFCVTPSLKKIYYWSFYEGQGALVEVKRDERYIEKLVQKEIAFFHLMETQESPELTEKDYSVRADAAFLAAEREYMEAEEMFKKVSERKEIARKKLLSLTDRSAIGNVVKVTMYMQKGNVDYAKIPELSGLDLEAYRAKPSQRWRISAK